jgi:phosphoglycolate phosphatase
MPYDLCVFDLDGTLTDPKTGITKSYQYALSAFGIHEELENLVQFIGPPLRETFSKTYGFSPDDTEKAVAKFREYFSKTGILENTVYPGIPELLQALTDKGKVLAVATNKVAVYSRRILEHFGLAQFFSAVSGDEMDGSLTTHGKREIIRLALDAPDPERQKAAVMIGDRKHDILGARDVGIDSIGVTWGYGSRAELEEAGATRIAESPDELLKML